ncbi:aminoacyl-tRNA hydrolase [Hydrogenimonas sp.]
MWLVVGLGNPGPQYELTRHNIGFLVLDRLIGLLDAHPTSSSSFHGELFKKNDLLLLKPMTYMNRSGISVSAVKNFYKIEMEHIIVIHDDIDLPFGAIRFKRGGGSGGHNGLKSIDAMVGNDYIRVRMGVGKPAFRSQVADYVLQPFLKEEQARLEPWIEHAAKATLELVRHSLEYVSSRYTVKNPQWPAI